MFIFARSGQSDCTIFGAVSSKPVYNPLEKPAARVRNGDLKHCNSLQQPLETFKVPKMPVISIWETMS